MAVSVVSVSSRRSRGFIDVSHVGGGRRRYQLRPHISSHPYINNHTVQPKTSVSSVGRLIIHQCQVILIFGSRELAYDINHMGQATSSIMISRTIEDFIDIEDQGHERAKTIIK